MREQMATMGELSRRWVVALGRLGKDLARRWREGRKWRRRTRIAIVGVVGFLAALAALLALGPGEVRSALDWFGGGGENGDSWSVLQVERPVVLTNGEAERFDVGGEEHWKRATMPQVDLTVRNEGDSRVDLGTVRIAILASERIDDCEPPQGGEGGIPVAESIFIDLPLLPSAEERIVLHPLHREVPPHHTTRLRLFLRSLDSEFATDLFALDISIHGPDPGQQIKIGNFIVGVPGAVPHFNSYLPEDPRVLAYARQTNDLLPITWCYRRNLAAVRRFLHMKGDRSAQMKALSYVHRSRSWSAAEDSLKPAAAARSLLTAGDFFEGPTLAIFAARRSGDQALLATIRREASAELRGSIRKDLSGSPPTAPLEAVLDARRLLAISGTEEAHSILGRSEAALRQSEDVRDQVTG